jgi:AcrR family transcriptional regulator
VTRGLIVQAALDQFAREGYAATSMRDIARQVGIQVASIYSHFGSKEEILWDAYKQGINTLAAMQAEGEAELEQGKATIEGRLRMFVRQHARFHAEHSQIAKIANSQMASLSAAHYDEAAQWRDGYEQSLRDLLQEAVNERKLAITDVKIYSYALLQMGMAIATWYRPDGEWSLQEVVDHYEEIAVRSLRLT